MFAMRACYESEPVFTSGFSAGIAVGFVFFVVAELAVVVDGAVPNR